MKCCTLHEMRVNHNDVRHERGSTPLQINSTIQAGIRCNNTATMAISQPNTAKTIFGKLIYLPTCRLPSLNHVHVTDIANITKWCNNYLNGQRYKKLCTLHVKTVARQFWAMTHATRGVSTAWQVCATNTRQQRPMQTRLHRPPHQYQ